MSELCVGEGAYSKMVSANLEAHTVDEIALKHTNEISEGDANALVFDNLELATNARHVDSHLSPTYECETRPLNGVEIKPMVKVEDEFEIQHLSVTCDKVFNHANRNYSNSNVASWCQLQDEEDGVMSTRGSTKSPYPYPYPYQHGDAKSEKRSTCSERSDGQQPALRSVGHRGLLHFYIGDVDPQCSTVSDSGGIYGTDHGSSNSHQRDLRPLHFYVGDSDPQSSYNGAEALDVEALVTTSAADVLQQLPEILNINVVTLAGTSVDKFRLDPNATIRELKAELVNLCNADPWHQTLSHGRAILEDTSRWTDTLVKDADDVMLTIQHRIVLDDATIWKAVADFCRGGKSRDDVERAYGHISRWDTAQVTNMYKLFEGERQFNADLNAWNVGRVTTMYCMFAGAESFNCDLSAWSVSNVRDMKFMFFGAESFNGDLRPWNVRNVTNMNCMFFGAELFEGDLRGWNVSNVTSMAQMFHEAASFNGDLNAWNVSNVTYMHGMFHGAKSFNSDLSKWNVTKVTKMEAMFCGAASFNSDLGKWNVSNVRDMTAMFSGASSFTGDLSAWNVGSRTVTTYMFLGAPISSRRNLPANR